MLLKPLNIMFTSLLAGTTQSTNAAPTPTQTATAPVQSDPVQATSSTGVIFDLSASARQTAAAAGTDLPDSSTGSTPVSQGPAPFLPAAMTIAAEIAAVRAAQPDQATATGSAWTSAAGRAASPQGQEPSGMSPSSVEAAADPDEEARARALAIQAQDRNQLLSLADRLSETRAESVASLTASARSDPADGKSSELAA